MINYLINFIINEKYITCIEKNYMCYIKLLYFKKLVNDQCLEYLELKENDKTILRLLEYSSLMAK